MLKTYRAASVSGMFGQYGGRFIPPYLEPYFVVLIMFYNQNQFDQLKIYISVEFPDQIEEKSV